MPTLDYPCGCRYRTDRNGLAWMPALVQCPEHAIVTEMAAVVADED